MNNRHTMLMPTRFRRFTLVELMAVIVIISIILAFTAPAFTRLMTGSAVNTGTTMLSAQLALARAEAATRRCKIAIAIYDATAPTSFRAAYQSGGVWAWLPGTKVEELPLGAVMAKFSANMPTSADFSSLAADFNSAKKMLTDPSPPANYAITVTVGSHTYTYPAMIFGANGRALEPYFLVVIEGVIQKIGSDSQLQKANPENARILKVSQFTGRVSYEKNPLLP